MNRTIGSILACSVAIVVASACVENKQSLQVRGAMAPPVPMMGQGCIYDPQPTSTKLFSGVLDIAFTNQYSPVLLVSNQIIPLGNSTMVRAESSHVQLEGATVRITDAVGNQLNSFTTTGAGFVPASNGTTPGFGAVSVTVIDANTIQGLNIPFRGPSRRLITFTKVFGHTLGGVKVEAAEFEFPVDVCNGCLVSFPADRNCTPSGSASVTSPCSFGQDQAIDCRLCSGLPACTP